MKPLTVLYTWLITLLIGLVLIAIISVDLATATVFTMVAAVFSLPYLILMFIAASRIKSFWVLQGIHLLIASFTSAIIFGMNEDFISEFYWVVFPYFGLGLAVHAFMKFKIQPDHLK